jgi:hypothetical protein
MMTNNNSGKLRNQQLIAKVEEYIAMVKNEVFN